MRLVERGIEAATGKMVGIAFDPRSAGAQIEGMKAGVVLEVEAKKREVEERAELRVEKIRDVEDTDEDADDNE